MRGWQFDSPATGLEYIEPQAPGPGPRQVLIDVEVPTHLLVTKNVQLRGSRGAGVGDLQAAPNLLAQKELAPVIEEESFTDIPTAPKRPGAGQVHGHLVTRPGPSARER